VTGEPDTRRDRPPAVQALPHRAALTEDVYEAVKALIMDGAVDPGAALTIDTLARELGVSPTPVREALARLESDGLARKDGKRGYFATNELTLAEVEQMYDFRLLVEPWAVRRAAKLATPEQALSLRKLVEAVPEMPTSLGYRHLRAMSAHDALFHGQILRFSQNEFVANSFERSHCFLHLFRLQYNQPSILRSAGEAVEEHRIIAGHISEGDSDAAERSMVGHLDRARQRVRHMMGESSDHPSLDT
jgi:DNA-binding GntR family transcriptional regulator